MDGRVRSCLRGVRGQGRAGGGTRVNGWDERYGKGEQGSLYLDEWVMEHRYIDR